MTTQNMHPENSDVDVSGAEQTVASENMSTPTSPDASESVQVHSEETGAEIPAPQHEQQHYLPSDNAGRDEFHASSDEVTGLQVAIASTEAGTPQEPEAPGVEEQTLSAEPLLPQVEEGIVRPFTDFIEEFRQAEARQVPSTADMPYSPLDLLLPTFAEAADSTTPAIAQNDAFPPLEVGPAPETIPGAASITPDLFTGIAEPVSSIEEKAPAPVAEEAASPKNGGKQSAPPTLEPRPVSPLLRPASRVRVPRYAGRQREMAVAAEKEKEKAAQAAAEAEAAATTPAPTEETPRPTRRYRFDRPGAKNGTPATPVRPEENKSIKEQSATINSVQAESEAAPVVEPTKLAPGVSPLLETPATKPATTPEAAPTEGGERDRRRRHGTEKQREKEKEQAAPVASVETLAAAKAATPESEETPPEELPPLEYSELQAASSRRRRRRRNGSTVPVAPVPPVAPVAAAPKPTPTIPEEIAPIAVPPVSTSRNVTVPSSQYNIVSGYTVSQMNQGNEISGPFMGPEPSPARGSGTGGTREHRSTTRAESQRSPSPIYPLRSNEPSSSSVHQLTNAVVQAIQTQTDRMVAEMRRVNQVPTNVSVSLPPFPSTERVGVFVDVANLLYSARTLRLTVDFGKLLDFLRGNRRLIRAHAYCPTSPQPGDEQMFLQAVKGLGYRITTKNYKTFSSGAKKADLDLDLCMDIVRLVDGGAVDCIVLVSGDSDFMPVLDYCSDHGVRVEVAAFDEAMSATLRQSCDLFINLSMLEEIRG